MIIKKLTIQLTMINYLRNICLKIIQCKNNKILLLLKILNIRAIKLPLTYFILNWQNHKIIFLFHRLVTNSIYNLFIEIFFLRCLCQKNYFQLKSKNLINNFNFTNLNCKLLIIGQEQQFVWLLVVLVL